MVIVKELIPITTAYIANLILIFFEYRVKKKINRQLNRLSEIYT